MKITESRIRRIIREEIKKSLFEVSGDSGPGVHADYPFLEKSDDGKGTEVFMTGWKNQSNLFGLLGKDAWDENNIGDEEIKEIVRSLDRIPQSQVKFLIDLKGGKSCPGYVIPNKKSNPGFPIIIYEDESWESTMMTLAGARVSLPFDDNLVQAMTTNINALIANPSVKDVRITEDSTGFVFFIILNLDATSGSGPRGDKWPPDPCVVARRWRELRTPVENKQKEAEVKHDSEGSARVRDDSDSVKMWCDQFPTHPTCKD